MLLRAVSWKVTHGAAVMTLPRTKAATTMHATQHDGHHNAIARRPPIISRELLATGGATELMLKDEPAARLLTPAEREASLTGFIKSRPAGDLWIFGYGSLIWNPALKSAERRIAHISGWHRSFCLSMTVGRGTPDRPGLVLGLDRGGICKGVADRIAESDIVAELAILWDREMLFGGYNPTWVDLIGADGARFGSAIALTIDRGHPHYAGRLPQHETIRRLATGAGSWGSSADYLFRTIHGLRAHGISDEAMERLGDHVEAANCTQQLALAA